MIEDYTPPRSYKQDTAEDIEASGACLRLTEHARDTMRDAQPG